LIAQQGKIGNQRSRYASSRCELVIERLPRWQANGGSIPLQHRQFIELCSSQPWIVHPSTIN
jgi:hypothetical protein